MQKEPLSAISHDDYEPQDIVQSAASRAAKAEVTIDGTSGPDASPTRREVQK